MATRIKTSQHTTKYANCGKHVLLRDFLIQYTSAVNFYVDYVWNNVISWEDKDGTIHTSDIKKERYDLPKYISTVGKEPPSCALSARALKSASSVCLDTDLFGKAKMYLTHPAK